MRLRMILRSTCLTLGLLAGLPASAQTAPPAPPVGSIRSQVETAPPVSATVTPHAQPRTASVPLPQDDSANSPYRETAEDAQMNRMIRNICRGC